MQTPLELATRKILGDAATQIVDHVRRSVAAAIGPMSTARLRPREKVRHKRHPKRVPLRLAVADVEREHIQLALSENGRSVIRAAHALAMPVTTLKYKLKKYRIR